MKSTGIRIVITAREVYALALAAAAMAIFWNSLRASFVWDDAAFVQDNVYLQSWSSIPRLFSENMTAGAGIAGGIYRPLQSLTHFCDLQLWGLDPWGHHLTNVLLHAAATVSVFYWLAGLAPLSGAALAALLFSLHPLQSEAVAYVSGRGDTLAILFTCAGLALSLSRPRIALACALLAMLSKENAVLFPVLLWLHNMAAGRRSILREQAPFWALAVIYAAFHLVLFHFEPLHPVSPGVISEFSSHVQYRLFTYIPTLPMGLRLWVWPMDLHHERSWGVYRSWTTSVWLSLIGILLAPSRLLWKIEKRNLWLSS